MIVKSWVFYALSIIITVLSFSIFEPATIQSVLSLMIGFMLFGFGAILQRLEQFGK